MFKGHSYLFYKVDDKYKKYIMIILKIFHVHISRCDISGQAMLPLRGKGYATRDRQGGGFGRASNITPTTPHAKQPPVSLFTHSLPGYRKDRLDLPTLFCVARLKNLYSDLIDTFWTKRQIEDLFYQSIKQRSEQQKQQEYLWWWTWWMAMRRDPSDTSIKLTPCIFMPGHSSCKGSLRVHWRILYHRDVILSLKLHKEKRRYYRGKS